MMFRRKHREVPGLNTTSTADISFMLLVFFLVTSSMDTDHGLGRKLSPMDDQKQEQQDINRSNVLQISIDDNDMLSCDEKTVTLDELRQQVESFVVSRQNNHHVIAVETGRKTSYDAYFNMQHAIVQAYHNLRERMAQKEYGCHFAQCSEGQREAIIARYPQRISEGMIKR